MPEISGTVRRQCSQCGSTKLCNCITSENKTEILCQKCTYEKYKIGKKPNQDINNDYGVYNTKNMKRSTDKDSKTHAIQLFECDNCGRVFKKRVKKREGRKCLKD
jgi:protein-arginine kinase activator protein McsA